MTPEPKMIDVWFPCAAVDQAVGTADGSGLSEKAIFTWFASRPIAQARAAVLTALLPDKEELRPLVNRAIGGDRGTLNELASLVRDSFPAKRPIVLDPFSGRGIIPLEAARIGVTAVGLDLSPLAALAGRLLADYPLRDWSNEPPLPFTAESTRRARLMDDEPRLLTDLRLVLAVIGDRVQSRMAPHYPKNRDGTWPWGYIWAITIPCDGCRRRFPLIGSLVLRHPYKRTDDPGQSYRLIVDKEQGRIRYEVFDGVPDQQPPLASAGGRRSARCPFCRKSHSLDTVKQKGFASQYEDTPVLAVDAHGDKKIFRPLREGEAEHGTTISLADVPSFGPYPVIPNELIPLGNEDTVRPSGYGYRNYGELMNRRQTLQFLITVMTIREAHAELVEGGISSEYAEALAAYAAATLVRKMRYSTRGASLRLKGKPDGSEQNRVMANDIFASESKVSFSFDYFEAGIGEGPGTWTSLVETGLTPLNRHLRRLTGIPGRFRQGSAMALPFRDGTIDAVVTDPPYYNMIDYSDASDLFFVWLKRALFDIVPDLFDVSGVQPKDDEIIVKRGNAPGEHRTKAFYEASLAKSFAECRRVLRSEGSLVVVFGHSDPDAWKRLLAALHEAGFVVTRTWPSRTESANTGVASIKVTVTIGCRIAPSTRAVATAAQVDREVVAAVKAEVPQWESDGLALTDQLMAAYGPAMEVCGRYSKIIQPDSMEAPIERYLTLARTAVRDAVALKIEKIPLETFDATTRFAIFWMRLYGQGNCPKSEARFLAQADGLRIDQIRGGLLSESKAGYKITLDAPGPVSELTPVFNVIRAMVAAQPDGTEAVAQVISDAGRSPDDEQVWAVVSELTYRLPTNAAEAKSLTAIQRTADTIKQQVRGLATAKAHAEGQHTLFGSEA